MAKTCNCPAMSTRCCIVVVRATRPPLPLRSTAGGEQKSWNVVDTAATQP